MLAKHMESTQGQSSSGADAEEGHKQDKDGLVA